MSLRKSAVLKLPSVFFNVTSQQFDFSEASEVAQWVSVLATRSDDLNLIVISRIHMVEGENQSLYMCISTCMFPLYSPLSQMKNNADSHWVSIECHYSRSQMQTPGSLEIQQGT